MHDENMYTMVPHRDHRRQPQAASVHGICRCHEIYHECHQQSATRQLYNCNCLLSVYYDKNYYNAKAQGMNAGSTPEGGHCVVTASTNGELTYIAVAMGGETVDGKIYSYIDVTRMIDWAFASYGYVNVLSPDQVVCEIPVTLSTAVDYVTLVAGDTLPFICQDTIIKRHHLSCDVQRKPSGLFGEGR